MINDKLVRLRSAAQQLSSMAGRRDPEPPQPEPAHVADRPDRPPSRGPRSTWFWDHYDSAAGEVVDFLGGDGIRLTGTRVADVGCGDGILDLGLAHRAQPAALVGFDVNPIDLGHLQAEAEAEGAWKGMPTGLRFETCGDTEMPAPDSDFDVVVTWSAFEHIRRPVPVLREIRRVLRPGGVLMVQLWPFFHSEHGSHLMDWYPEGFAHLLLPEEEVHGAVRAQDGHDPGWTDYMLKEFRALNRITVDELQNCLLAAGFTIAKLELLSNSIHIPPALAHYPVSLLGITGVKLIATPR